MGSCLMGRLLFCLIFVCIRCQLCSRVLPCSVQALRLPCGTRDLGSPTRDRTCVPSTARQILEHQAPKEVPSFNGTRGNSSGDWLHSNVTTLKLPNCTFLKGHNINFCIKCILSQF